MRAVFEQEAGRFPSKNFSQFCRCGLDVYDLIYVSKIYVKYGIKSIYSHCALKVFSYLSFQDSGNSFNSVYVQ